MTNPASPDFVSFYYVGLGSEGYTPGQGTALYDTTMTPHRLIVNLSGLTFPAGGNEFVEVQLVVNNAVVEEELPIFYIGADTSGVQSVAISGVTITPTTPVGVYVELSNGLSPYFLSGTASLTWTFGP